MATNELFQYSVVSALVDGVASDGLPIADLLSNGDHGLGTFRHMAGEMIVLDGRAYQMRSDGTVSAVALDDGDDTKDVGVTPFAMVTRFRPTVITTAAAAALPDKESLAAHLSGLFPGSRNVYLAFRLRGLFSSITVRTAAGQCRPGEGLVDVVSRQVAREFTDIRGTVVGFRSPAFLQGVSVAGDHLHFISDDGASGGHMLAMRAAGDIEVEAARISRITLDFPTDDPQFSTAKLEGDSAGIEAAEG